MSYAKTTKRNDKVTTRTKANKAAQTGSQIRSLDAKNKGRIRDTKRYAKSCSDTDATDAFLSAYFPPLLEQLELPVEMDQAKIEKDFYESLSILTKRYDLKPIDTSAHSFPYNIATALSAARTQLRNQIDNWRSIRLVHHGQRVFFAEQQNYETSSTLFYIPVIPLYLMLHNPKRRAVGNLLLSVFAYLYRIVEIPYYTQQGSYLYGTYEMIEEWSKDDEDNADPILLAELRRADYIGIAMQVKIRNVCNIEWFQHRLTRFKCRDEFEGRCAQLAAKFFEHYKQYPTATVFDKIPSAEERDEDEDDERIYIEQYVSFFASADGWLSEQLFEVVNNDLQEYGHIEEPVIYKPVDGQHTDSNDFGFEQGIFELIEELTTLLNYE